MRKIKEEKGSITLYVIVSMIFFLIVVVAIYVSSTNKKIIQEKQIEDIQKSYQTEDINAIYDEAHYSDTKYLEVQTLEELQKALDDEDAKYIKLTANIITTNGYLIVSQTNTIDLNGFTYSSREISDVNKAIIVTGENTILTIEDSSQEKSGKIITTDIGTNNRIISVEENAKLKLESGTISNDNTDKQTSEGIYLSNGCKFIMNGGKITLMTNEENNTAINLDGENSELTFNNGDIIGNIIQNSIAKIIRGNIQGDIFAKQPDKMSIENATITGKLKILNNDTIQNLDSSAVIESGIETINQ